MHRLMVEVLPLRLRHPVAHRRPLRRENLSPRHQIDSESGVTAVMLGWRQEVGDNDNPVRDLISPTDSVGFYWTKSGMARYADRPTALERRVISATRPPDPHHPHAPNPAINKIYYHSMNFRDASASVNYPAVVGNPNSHFNGFIARCVGYAQVLAVLGEYKFPDASGAFTLAFPEGRQPRRG
jgi:hypothetical protein